MGGLPRAGWRMCSPCSPPPLPPPLPSPPLPLLGTPRVSCSTEPPPQSLSCISNLRHTAMVEQSVDPRAGPGQPGGGWTLVPSISAVIKYSCFICWSREKSSVEEEIKENAVSVSQRTCEIQELQEEVQQESGELRQLQSRRWQVQEVLGELEQKKGDLEGQLGHIQEQCSLENQLILSLQGEQLEQQQQIEEVEEELLRAQEALWRLREEAARAGERLEATRTRLGPLRVHVRDSHASIAQLQLKLDELQHTDTPLREELEPLTNGIADVKTKVQMTAEPLQWESGQLEWRGEEEQVAPKEQEPKADVSEELHGSRQPQQIMQSRGSSSPSEVAAAQKEDLQQSVNTSDFKVSLIEEAEPVEQAKAPTVGTLDFFNSDPFTDNDPFEDSPFGAADVSDIFSRDPFKGTDPFSSDALFGEPSPKPFGDVVVPAESRPFNCQFSGWVKEPILSENGKESTVLLVFEADSPTDDEPVQCKELSTVDPDPLAPSQRIEGSSNDSSSMVTVTRLPKDLEELHDSRPVPFAEASGSLPLAERFADFGRLSFSTESLASCSTENQDDSSAEDSEDENLDTPPRSPGGPPPLPPGPSNSSHHHNETEACDFFPTTSHRCPLGDLDNFSTSDNAEISGLAGPEPEMRDPPRALDEGQS
ncbi:epidermal growth factor receptor substrate 15-like [Brienomyrus brachyistius]|uniref:epidermal growth factor receptor substrate 15-like n=1 Tax=Brienomyrus brachyistius TaxID=42636 RepID=UPI0020B191E1|nr:epidermal growth factor receptor substrate 15-like [Brienomyrus brachyistius]